MATSLIFVLGLIGFCSAALPLPSYITPCARSDPEFKQCVVEHARSTIPHIVFTGDKKYRVPVLEPLEITEIRIDQGASQAGLSLAVKDCKVYGLKDLHVEDVSFDFENNKMSAELHIKNAVILGNYTASGRILLLPIYGNGDINITLVNAVAKFAVDFEKVTKKDDMEYIRTFNPHGSLDVSRMFLRIENLFNGERALGEQMNLILNENWRSVFEDLEPAIKEALIAICDSILGSFVGLVPFDVIFPNKIP